MVFIFLLIIIGAIVYFKMVADPKDVKERCKGRNADQKQVIRYFMLDGCLRKTMSDAEYDAKVQAFANRLNAREKAMNKIGLDESELREIEPVHFEGYRFYQGEKYFGRRGKDGIWRSSVYEISWLFFSSTQVYLYQYRFNMDEDGKKEITEEYFYKDINSLSTSSDTVETPYWSPKEKKMLLENVNSNRFKLGVSGEQFYCAMEQNDYTEKAIQGMKAKLREKKNA